MSFSTSRYGIGNRENLFDVFGGLARSILGSNGKFNFSRDWKPQNSQVDLVDCSWGNLMTLANNVPHLNIVISEGAKMFSGMEIKHFKGKGKAKKEVENSEILKFLSEPNVMQSQTDWLYEYYVQNAIYKTTFGYVNAPSRLSPTPTSLWWLPGEDMKINLTGKMYDQIAIEGIIESYELMTQGKKYEPKDVIHILDGISQNKITAKPTIETLQITLSNIIAVLKSYNIITTEKGMIGFIGGDAKDSTGMGIQMSDVERVQFENQYQKDYGLDSRNGHVMITQAPLKWVPMTFNVKDLMLFEGLEDSFAQVIAAYGHKRDMYPSVKGATFENQKEAITQTYQNTMQPLGVKMLGKLSKRFGLTANDEYLYPSFEHVPAMQENKVEKETAKKLKAETSTIHLQNGAINIDSYCEENEIENTGDGVSMTEKINKQNNDAAASKADKKPKSKANG